jgi:hypothetical protein
MPTFVASERARVGLRSGPKNLTTIADFCERYALKREQAPSPQVSLTQDLLSEQHCGIRPGLSHFIADCKTALAD